MNGLQSTPDLPGLVALEEPSEAAVSLPARCAQEDLPCWDADAPASRQCRVAAFQSEPLAGAAVPGLRELTKAICRGDEAAFTRFYDLYSLRLYKHLLVLAKGNEREAREVLQTVVVKLARGFKIFDEERRMWGWLCRLARNSYVDLCRTQRREKRFVSLEELQGELAEPGDGDQRMSASLHLALDQLTAEERELLRAAYVDERPLQELADASGKTYKALESRLGRLRGKLKMNLLKYLRHEECS